MTHSEHYCARCAEREAAHLARAEDNRQLHLKICQLHDELVRMQTELSTERNRRRRAEAKVAEMTQWQEAA